MGKTTTGRRKPAPRPLPVTIDGKVATPKRIAALNKPLMHVNADRISQSRPALYAKGVGLLGQVILQWQTLKRDLTITQKDEVIAVLRAEGLHPDMQVRNWENASMDMDVAAAWG